MKFLRKVISFLLTLLLGFWLATAGILNGTKIGEVTENIVSYFPDRNEINTLINFLPFNNFTKTDLNEQVDTPEEAVSFSDSEEADSEIDIQLVENSIFDLVNNLRQEQDLSTLAKNESLKEAAKIRAEETAESFSHTRPNGSEAVTVIQGEGIYYPYKKFGENLAMGTYYLEEKEMAELLFEGWVDSEGHYENMITPDYTETGIGVHYDGEYLYITQLFGTQI